MRGKFSFASNHHPVQDIFVREVIKEGEIYTNKIIATAITDCDNAYVGDCKM